MRRRRIERLEKLLSNQSTPWTDPLPIVMRVMAAFDAERGAEKHGREFSRIPHPAAELDAEAEHRLKLAMRPFDIVHNRLTATEKAARRAAKRERRGERRAEKVVRRVEPTAPAQEPPPLSEYTARPDVPRRPVDKLL